LKYILPICRKKGIQKYILKAVQASAFVLWKQSRFMEALELFHEIENMVGISPALFENIGHTYNSLGNYLRADNYFNLAKRFSTKNLDENIGGILLGLGLVKERIGRPLEAIRILKQSLETYKNKFKDEETSLIAKAHMGVGGCLMLLKNVEAEQHFKEAIRIFKLTCGAESPLTANAMYKLATFLIQWKRFKEAHPYVVESLKLESLKDAFNLTICCEIIQLSQIINNVTRSKKSRKISNKKINALYRPYIPVIRTINKRILEASYHKKDLGTTAVWYKWGGEHCAIAQVVSTI